MRIPQMGVLVPNILYSLEVLLRRRVAAFLSKEYINQMPELRLCLFGYPRRPDSFHNRSITL